MERIVDDLRGALKTAWLSVMSLEAWWKISVRNSKAAPVPRHQKWAVLRPPWKGPHQERI
ncbi:conserved hypothetical protein [Ricinus communis]|uniref:Uncharacterized protein n=1 Tax=Ricinus communis TaxID=3988 RepID=B9RMI2_RICCO|nr:conserved hypothetical protein [Ricinus communis]